MLHALLAHVPGPRRAALVALGVLLLAPAPAHAAPDLSIASLTSSPNPVASWQNPTATVTITARNTGDATATVVAILFDAKDPEQVESLTCPPGFTAHPIDAPVKYICAWGTMPPGSTVTMTVGVRIDETSTPVASVVHTAKIAEVRQTGNVPDPTPADTTASETLAIGFDTTINQETGKPGSGEDGGSGRDDTRPSAEVTALSLSRTTFRAAKRGPSAVAAARPPIGTTVTTKLSAAATLVFRVERAAAGRRSGSRCVAPTSRNRTAKRCTRWVTMSGKFTADGEAGTNRLTFTGRLGGLRLAPGRYRLAVTAKDARGRESAARRAAFRIVA